MPSSTQRVKFYASLNEAVKQIDNTEASSTLSPDAREEKVIKLLKGATVKLTKGDARDKKKAKKWKSMLSGSMPDTDIILSGLRQYVKTRRAGMSSGGARRTRRVATSISNRKSVQKNK